MFDVVEMTLPRTGAVKAVRIERLTSLVCSAPLEVQVLEVRSECFSA